VGPSGGKLSNLNWDRMCSLQISRAAPHPDVPSPRSYVFELNPVDEVNPAPPFRPIQTRSLFALCALGLQALNDLLMILLLSYRIELVTKVRDHVAVFRQNLLASDSAIAADSRVNLVLLIVSALAFFLWLYRASQNLRAFRPEPFEFSPSYAVGSFFIPVLSFYLPFYAMSEIWQASDPSIPPFGETPDTPFRVPLLLRFWWGCFLVRGIVGLIANVSASGSPTVESVLTASRIHEFSLFISIVAAALACVLIFRVRRRQELLGAQLADLKRMAEVF
jgi:hypothetical protein